MSATLVLYNARVYSPLPATAVAVRGDRILALGADSEMRALGEAGSEQIDLRGALVLPGLVDAHVHFEWFSLNLTSVDVETDTLAEALRRVAERAAATPKGRWVRGHGWNYTRWGGEFPTAAQLDAAVPDHPVYLTAKSMHAGWANSLGLRLAGVTAATADPPGGKIVRDAAGSPTGVLLETAMDLISKRSYTAMQSGSSAMELTAEDVAKAMLVGQEKAWQVGLTGVHDFDGVRAFAAYQILRERGQLGLRVVKNIPVAYLDHAVALGLRTGFGDPWIRIGNVKIFADGALGLRTATMIEPYEGEPENYGIVVTDKEEIYERGSLAARHGLALTVHAIGDRANHDLLDVFEMLRAEEEARRAALPSAGPLRHRAEHLQLVHPDDAPRFAALQIVGSMQPIHATSDMLMADKYWGRRSAGAYAWRTQLGFGTVLAFGSDTPVEPIHPLWGIHAAVTRRRADGTPGPDGWYPHERLTVAQAVDGYTKGPAYAGHNQAVLGTIEAGKLADLTIVDRDLFACPAMEIREAAVVATMVGGQFKYRASGW